MKSKERARRYSNRRDYIECPTLTLVTLKAENTARRDIDTKIEIIE